MCGYVEILFMLDRSRNLEKTYLVSIVFVGQEEIYKAIHLSYIFLMFLCVYLNLSILFRQIHLKERGRESKLQFVSQNIICIIIIYKHMSIEKYLNSYIIILININVL